MASMSRAGTITGGWLTIRYRPSTCSPSFDSACRLSLVCAFSAVLRAVFAPLGLAASFLVRRAVAAERMASMTSCSVTWEYQMSMVPMPANSAMASR